MEDTMSNKSNKTTTTAATTWTPSERYYSRHGLGQLVASASRACDQLTGEEAVTERDALLAAVVSDAALTADVGLLFAAATGKAPWTPKVHEAWERLYRYLGR
jgi:hypothetical protein